MQFSSTLITVALAAFSSVTSATRVHINTGCVLINYQPKCSGSDLYDVASGSVRIHAKFDSQNKAAKAYSGCIKRFYWPANYGDVYYGQDNCLYDSSGNKIDGQCCTEGYELVQNPYA